LSKPNSHISKNDSSDPTRGRRHFLSGLGLAGLGLGLQPSLSAQTRRASDRNPDWEAAIRRGLDYLTKTQSSRGQWNTPPYPVAIGALAGTAMICSGSTITQGPYSKYIARAVDYLISQCQPTGLIGDPINDSRYTYGHGFSMLFLSQVLGEEGLQDRRDDLVDVLTKAVKFCGQAQTPDGGWGYLSAKDDNNFDEGSTTITQVQGLRGCRNAGIPVPNEIIEAAKRYIYKCQNDDGGISYSSQQMGSSRPAITAASLAALYNAGDYDSKKVPEMLAYCRNALYSITAGESLFGHWHYTYMYYSQVVYRQGDEDWLPFRDRLYDRIVSEQSSDGGWEVEGGIHKVYTTACSLIMLQLDKGYLPIFQR
jgi:hypothetical protein